MKLLQNRGNSVRNMHLLFLLAAGSVIFVFVPIDCLSPGMGYFLAEKYLSVPCLLFFGSAMTQQLSASAKRNLLLSAIAVLWFATAQLQHHLAQMGTSSFSIFSVVYLLAFPFASASEQDAGTAGIKWIGKIYVAASLLLVLCGVMLLLESVPASLASWIVWDGARLYAMWHPNVLACIFMIGIGFTLFFLVQTNEKWKKAALALISGIQFCGMILTNSRTSILLTCALFGGTVFFAFWKGGMKRFLLGAAIVLAVVAALFVFSLTLFQTHTQTQIGKLIQQESQVSAEESHTDNHNSQTLIVDEYSGEVYLAGNNNQGSLTQDLWTLNKRTYIWSAAFTALRDNPAIQKWGTENVSMEISYRNIFPVGHAHNSWVQVLMKLGIPGLLVSLVYTAIALFHSASLLLRQGVDLSKKIAAILVLLIMAAGFLEPYLFVGDIFTLFVNFIFFFLTGYLNHWSKELSVKKANGI